MNTRYEVVDGAITKIDETRTPFALERAAEAMNDLVSDAGDYKKRIAELETKLKQAREGWSNTGNDLAVRDGQLAEAKKRIAELEAAQAQPAVTPEWLAEKHQDAMSALNSGCRPWSAMDVEEGDLRIAAAARVLEQTPQPAPAPVVVDVKQLVNDYETNTKKNHAKPCSIWPLSLERALEAQGVKCKEGE